MPYLFPFPKPTVLIMYTSIIVYATVKPRLEIMRIETIITVINWNECDAEKFLNTHLWTDLQETLEPNIVWIGIYAVGTTIWTRVRN